MFKTKIKNKTEIVERINIQSYGLYIKVLIDYALRTNPKIKQIDLKVVKVK
jgi:hypothetical protein